MGGEVVTETADMIAGMNPVLDPQIWRFVQITPDNASTLLGAAIATFRESEGVSAIVPAARADEAGQPGPDFRRITLQVLSDLEGVGLTAAVSGALAEAGIACNMVAALHHDHAFVPAGQAAVALEMLEALSRTADG